MSARSAVVELARWTETSLRLAAHFAHSRPDLALRYRRLASGYANSARWLAAQGARA